MPFCLDDLFVVGISSSALFDTREEERVFNEQGLQAFVDTQIAQENIAFRKGTAFPLIEALLRLNQLSQKQLVEVVVLSHNNPAAGLRAMNSVDHYGLRISRAAFVGDGNLSTYLKPYRIKLFLSRNEGDVRAGLGIGVASGLLYDPPTAFCSNSNQLRIAFDGDAVIFSDESERIYKETKSLEKFYEHERANAEKVLADGPFAAFLRWIGQVQADSSIRNPDGSKPIRTALVTARNGPAIKRVFLTLRAWNITVDEEFFLGGVPKREILKAFNPHIFFDDQEVHAQPASEVVSTALVPTWPRVQLPIIVNGNKAGPPALVESSTSAVRERRYRTKKECEARLREVLLGYTPLQRGVLAPRYRKFVNDTLARPALEWPAVVDEVGRMNLSWLTATHDPMLNREENASVEAKLAGIDRRVDEGRQGSLNLR